jgi:chaperonin GroEL
VTGATLITSKLGLSLEEATEEMLGLADRVTVTKDRSVLLATGDQNAKVEERIKEVRAELESIEGDDSNYEREKCEERIAKLSGCIAHIRVGAATETELKDKKLRYEDALNSCKKSFEVGILPGGGSTFVYLQRYKDEIQSHFDDEVEKQAVELLFEAILAPINQLATNCGFQSDEIREGVMGKEFGFGWNAATSTFEDLFEAGVIDPASVTIQSLLTSVSIAASIITTGVLVTDVPTEEEETDAVEGLEDESYA